MRIELVPEYRLTRAVEAQLQDVLEECFPDMFGGRSYLKQLPHFRLLAFDDDNVIGQAGLDVRIINVGGTVLKIFGVIDVFVQPEHRGRGVASALMTQVEKLAIESGRDFLVLIAERHDLYLRHGFRRVQPANVKWLAIEDRASVTLLEEDLSDCFMMKPVGPLAWPKGQIDMMGYLF